jgi:hypothetical protein
MPTHEVYVLLTKGLNSLVRMKFGKQFSVRLNSIHFFRTEPKFIILIIVLEKIYLKSNKPVLVSELESIELLIL